MSFKFFPIYFEGRPAGYEDLDDYSINDIEEIKINFSDDIQALTGTAGSKGVILITKKRKSKKNQK